MKYYIGIDLGTSSLKVLLVDDGGKVANSVTKEYQLFYPNPGWSEQRPEDWWEALLSAVDELTKDIDKSQVVAMGTAGQMHGLVVLDKDDKVIRPAILWNDGRTGAQTDYLNEQIGRETLTDLTANIAFAGFTLPKILWLKENERENFEKIQKIMLPKDYLNYKLTGVYCTDLSDASGTLLLDVKNRRWSEEMMRICDISNLKMPKLLESYERVGTLSKEVAERLNLNQNVVVVAGAGDNAAAAIGTGTIGEGKCNISIGTSGTVFVSADKFAQDKYNAIHSFCHADGGYHLMGCMLSAALCNKWFCIDILGSDYSEQESAIERDTLGKNDIFFLPYLMGERSPINDTNATGVFIGLRPNATKSQMYQAVLEGVAFAIRDNIEIIKKLGINISNSTLCGGGAKSKVWCEIFANVLNIELGLPKSEEGPGYGAAILAMVGSGEYESVLEPCERFCGVKKTISPTAEIAKLYEEKYQKFKKIYPAIKGLYKEIN